MKDGLSSTGWINMHWLDISLYIYQLVQKSRVAITISLVDFSNNKQIFIPLHILLVE